MAEYVHSLNIQRTKHRNPTASNPNDPVNMAEGFDVHDQKGGKQTKESTLEDKCRAAILAAAGIDNAEDLRGKLELPKSLISFLTEKFGSDDFFINSDDVTADDICAETYNAICTLNKQSVVLKCIPYRVMNPEKSELLQKWRNEMLSGIQKCLVSFREGQKDIYVLQGDLMDLKKIVENMKRKGRQTDEASLWHLLEKIVQVLQGLQDKKMQYKNLELSRICLDKSGKVWLSNPIRYIDENSDNDPFAVSGSGSNSIYTPPEIISGEAPTIKSTVWVIGCIMYEVAMKKPAFATDGTNIFVSLSAIVEGRKPESLRGTYSSELQETIWSCLKTEKHERLSLKNLLMKAVANSKKQECCLKEWII